MTYKMQQVLRTNRSLKSANGTSIPSGTRVVVMNQPTDSQVRVKVQDTSLPHNRGERIVAGVSYFNLTHRGRPKTDTPTSNES